MLFDLEDYSTGGVIGNGGQWVQDRNSRNFDWGDLQWTSNATCYSNLYSIMDYFHCAIRLIPNSDKPQAVQKMHIFVDKARAYRIAHAQFWKMARSFHVKFVEGGTTFANGDRYDRVPADQATNLDPISMITGYGSFEDIRDYPEHLKYVTGEKSDMRCVLNSQGEYEYQEFDNEIRLAYISAMEEMMAAEKDLIVFLEGGEDFYYPA